MRDSINYIVWMCICLFHTQHKYSLIMDMQHIKYIITLQILDAKCLQFVSNSLRLKRINYNNKHTHVGC